MRNFNILKVLFVTGFICLMPYLTFGTGWESASEKSNVDKKISEVDAVIQKGAFKDDWDSLKNYKIPEWYQDAKFGIFIHWGLYSVPGYNNEWYSRNMYQKDLTWDDAFKHHVATYGPQTKFGYKDFIPMFKAEKFDPAHWAKLFKESGAKYVVPVAEHHDGFAMYDSELSRWTAAEMGPKKNLLGLETQAYRDAGLMAGCSSHRAEHWWFMSGGKKFDSDVQDPKFADFYGPAEEDYSTPSEEYMRNWLARSCELVDKYKPQILYFDWWVGEKTEWAPYLRKFAAFYYNRGLEWGKGVVLNTKDKAFVTGTSVQDVEKGKLPGINPVAWQTDTSVSWKSWAYLKDDQIKDSGYLIRTLIDAVSKNGNLLLDIGPKPDGTIPEGQEKVLREIGDWLKVNGEAIYGTRPWVINGEGPTGNGGGKFSETDMKYQEEDVRFTRKGNILYVISMVCPTKSLKVTNISGTKRMIGVRGDISILGSAQKVALQMDKSGLILPPPEKPSGSPVVYKVPLGGFASTQPLVTVKGLSLEVSAEIQNYNAEEFIKDVALSLDGKETASQRVTIGPRSALWLKIHGSAPHPGYYDIALSWPGQAPLKTKAALPAIDLSGEWLFQKGDSMKWALPGWKDKTWQKVKLPDSWESHSNYKDDNVYGWYRKHFTLPKEWKGHSIDLPLGKIDDTDASYFNGVKIGQTGEFPPKFQGFWDKPRKYEVPAKLIHFGRDNVISIRVFDATGGGGLYDGPLGPIEVK